MKYKLLIVPLKIVGTMVTLLTVLTMETVPTMEAMPPAVTVATMQKQSCMEKEHRNNISNEVINAINFF